MTWDGDGRKADPHPLPPRGVHLKSRHMTTSQWLSREADGSRPPWPITFEIRPLRGPGSPKSAPVDPIVGPLLPALPLLFLVPTRDEPPDISHPKLQPLLRSLLAQHSGRRKKVPRPSAKPMNHYLDQQRSTSAVGAKTARACDSCLRRRARWYCAADDAFLCQACDASVHSANPLARRHHRLLLKTSSSSSSPLSSNSDDAPPPWLHGFKRKARTPRVKPAPGPVGHPKSEPLVPDLEADEKLHIEEEHLLYRVPIFDPVLDANTLTDETKPAVKPPEHAHVSADSLAGFHPSDLDLTEFAADVETLLGRGLDDDSFCIEGLGLMDSREDDDKGRVKVELDIDAGGGSDVMACNIVDMDQIDLSRETLELDFGCGSPAAGVELEEQKAAGAAAMASGGGRGVETVRTGRRMILRLDYEAVIAAWSCMGCSPWTGGERPQFNPDDCCPDFTGMMRGDGGFGGGGGVEVAPMYGEVGMVVGDGGREARVTRYREKRRTRLFSKKIRYEVRKLNAEKRPRMKGRFVKRAAFPAAGPAAASFPP